MLPSAKRTYYGTYSAEQVAVGCYDLVCTSHAEDCSRPNTTQTSVGGSSSSSRPGTQGMPRRRQLAGAGGKVQCTELPSLNNLELLLDPTHGGAQKAQSARDTKQQIREEKAHQMRKMSARMCRGETLFSSRGRVEDRVTPGDMEVLASLTQPLPHFERQFHSPRRPHTVSPKRLSTRTNRTYHEVVEAGLSGTEFYKRPRKQRHWTRGHQQHSKTNLHAASTGTLRSSHSGKSIGHVEIGSVLDIAVLPEFTAGSEALLEVAYLSEALAPPSSGTTFQTEGGYSVDYEKDTIRGSPTVEQEEQTGTRSKRERESVLAPPLSSGARDARRPSGAKDARRPSVQSAADEAALSSAAQAGEEESPKKDQYASVLEGLTAAQKMTTQRREAAQSLRMFIFGGVTDSKKALSTKDIDRVLRDRSGTQHHIQLLYAFWNKLDSDKSGGVDLVEFKKFVEDAIKDIVDGQSRVRGGFSMAAFAGGSPEENQLFARQICTRVGQVLLGRKTVFVIEDVMRILWPCSKAADLERMKRWVNELELTTWRMGTPKQLGEDEFDSLAAVFHHFDADQSGSVSVEELVHSGLMDKDQATKYLTEVDVNGDGELSILEFTELFCPTGFKAHSDAKVGTDEIGRRLVFDERMSGWRLEDMDPGKAGLFS